MAFMNDFRSGANGNLLGLMGHPSDSYDGGPDDFTNQVLNFKRGQIERQNRIADVMLQHQLMPINRYAVPHTTNNLVSMGLTPANTQINTVAAPSQISPLDLAKLKQGEEKIQFNREKEQGELGFKQSNAETQNKIKQQRADIYDYKSKHPDHKFDFSGPTVKVANPADGSVYDTGVETGKLSMEDKLNLMNKNDVMRDTNRINLTESANTRRDNNQLANRLVEIARRGDESRKTNSARPTKADTPSQVNQNHINKAQELLNSNPEYAKYIKLGKSDNGKVNGFTIVAPNGADDPTYHKINESIYGGLGDVNIPSSKTYTNKDVEKNKDFNSSTTKHFTSKDNPKGWDIPMDKIDDFKKANPDAIESK